ncbi:hypothetical protein H2199_008677 [Coniosporium tulheliwenetii]|uniref:Uncharacterized protein n=1 Tax=Coniosporium tulheliwenetii TaxID=3383036 RepID=A0ACC2YIS0_9PEZI|nr:hypothetical protein H2199_008677 [Cladosporium sp. JES 115]
MVKEAATIKATVPVLSEHGNTITKVFYKNMLTAHPELNDIFNTANQINGHQPRALAGSLYAYADNIDDLGKLSPAVELICNKHASLYIRPEHYNIVGTLTSEIHDAWAAAYWQLANLMTQREDQLYKAADGWTDWRDLRIARKVPESAEITSFYFEPVDGNPCPARQYSLSDAPWPDYYRISVKREKGLDIHDPEDAGHPGYVSNVLHDAKKVGDVIQVSHPFGDFFLDPEEKTDAPVVLISAGVGLTCLLSIFNTLVARKSERPIVWIHAAKSTKSRAFEKHVRNVVRARDNVHAVFFTRNVGEDEVQGKDYDFQGRMDLDKLDKERDLFVTNREAQYFVCGPTNFMLDMKAKLESFGVDESRLKLELYGTGGVPKR